MKIAKLLLLALMSLSVTGCAGVLVAGAATTVNVVTDPRSPSELLDDQNISLEATALGNKPPFQYNVRVTSNSFQGNVLLMGQAVNQEYKDKLQQQIREIAGVKQVFNQLKVKPLLSVGDISKDTWITTKVKSRLLTNESLQKSKISVYTEDSEVYLVGAVSREQADIAVDIARNTSGVKRVNKVFYFDLPQPVPAKAESPSPAPTTEIATPALNSKPEPLDETDEAPSEVIPYIEPVEE